MGINFCRSSCSGIYTASNPVSFGCVGLQHDRVIEGASCILGCSPRNVFYCFILDSILRFKFTNLAVLRPRCVASRAFSLAELTCTGFWSLFLACIGVGVARHSQIDLLTYGHLYSRYFFSSVSCA
jgi:hypothetical protein